MFFNHMISLVALSIINSSALYTACIKGELITQVGCKFDNEKLMIFTH